MERKQYSKKYKEQVENYLKLVMIKKGNMSKQDVADLIDQSLQNYNQKLKRGSLNATELFMIADAMNADVKFVDRLTGHVIV